MFMIFDYVMLYRVSTTKPGHRHITHIKIIYELLRNILLCSHIDSYNYHRYKQCHQETFDVGNVESRNTFEI
jgi:hypothetical protein